MSKLCEKPVILFVYQFLEQIGLTFSVQSWAGKCPALMQPCEHPWVPLLQSRRSSQLSSGAHPDSEFNYPIKCA